MRCFNFLLFLCLSVPLLSAQESKKQFADDFLEVAELKKMYKKQDEDKLAFYYGLFSNKEYVNTHRKKFQGSSLGLETEIIQIPIWKDRQVQGEQWAYVARYYVTNPHKPLAQYINQIVDVGNGMKKIVQYEIDPLYLMEHKSEWMNPDAFDNLQASQLKNANCDYQANFVDNIGWLSSMVDDCYLGISSTYDKLFIENRVSADIWWTRLQMKNTAGTVVYAEDEFIPYQRLSQKEARKRIKQYNQVK